MRRLQSHTAELLTMDSKSMATQELYRKLKGILDNLGLKFFPFEKLVFQITELPVDNEERLSGCVEIIFEKAISEPMFIKEYSALAKRMMSLCVPSNDNPEFKVSFRKLLLNRCQKEFEKGQQDELDIIRRQKEIEENIKEDQEKRLVEEKEKPVSRSLRRSVGNIRFIGELFKQKMLTEKIMHECIKKLLDAEDEDSLEILCNLLKTAGKELDTDKAKKLMDSYFVRLGDKQGSVPSRISFMIKDLLEQRKNVYKKMRGILNKITPSTFEKLLTEIAELPIDNEIILSGCVAIIFEKAISDPKFVKEYSNLAQRMMSLSVPSTDNPAIKVTFRKLLLNRCQEEFEKDQQDERDIIRRQKEIDETTVEDQKKGLIEEKEQLVSKSRRRSLGNIRFVGELFKLKMLTEKIMHDCIKKLLDAEDEDSLELLCNLLETIGKELDTEKAKKLMDSYFVRLGGKQGNVPLRIRFMIKDLLEQRKNKWISVRVENIPKTNVGGLGSRGSSQNAEKPSMPSNRVSSPERSSSQAMKRDNSPQGAVQRISSPLAHQIKEQQPAKELSKETIEHKAKNLLEEYLHIQDLREAVTCVKELESSKSLHIFVSFAINYVLEKKELARILTGTLFHQLLSEGVLSFEQCELGFKDVLQEAESLAVDIPKIWEYLGEIVAGTIKDNDKMWQLLKTGCQELAANRRDILFRKTVAVAAQKLGADRTSMALRRSGMRWSDFVNNDLFSYAKQNSLEQLDPVREELIALLKQHSDNQPIFEWIQRNVTAAETETREFIRALMTAVCTRAIMASETYSSAQSASYSVSEAEIVSRQTLLQRYLDHKPDREIQALYALQSLVHSLVHPSNILHSCFNILYDKDIIAENVFWQWLNSTDPAEQTGKGVASQCVGLFFDWLDKRSEQKTGS